MLYFDKLNVENVLMRVEKCLLQEQISEAILLMAIVADEFSTDEVMRKVVASDNVGEIVRDKFEDGEWKKVRRFLEGVEDDSEEFFKINEDGMLENLKMDDVRDMLLHLKGQILNEGKLTLS